MVTSETFSALWRHRLVALAIVACNVSHDSSSPRPTAQKNMFFANSGLPSLLASYFTNRIFRRNKSSSARQQLMAEFMYPDLLMVALSTQWYKAIMEKKVADQIQGWKIGVSRSRNNWGLIVRLLACEELIFCPVWCVSGALLLSTLLTDFHSADFRCTFYCGSIRRLGSN